MIGNDSAKIFCLPSMLSGSHKKVLSKGLKGSYYIFENTCLASFWSSLEEGEEAREDYEEAVFSQTLG